MEPLYHRAPNYPLTLPMSSMNLDTLLIRTIEHFPKNIAVKYGNETITYEALDRQANLLAHSLIENDCKQGDFIAIHMEKSISFIISIFAITRIGAIYVPLDTRSPKERIEYILNDAGIRTIISSRKQEKRAADFLQSTLSEKAITIEKKTDCDNPTGWQTFVNGELFPEKEEHETRIVTTTKPEDGAYVLYTSGSTGIPKGVLLSQKSALTFIEWAYNYFSIDENDVVVSHAPFHFDLSIFDIFVSIKAGAQITILPPSISAFPASLGKFIEKHKITIWYSVPSVLINLIYSANIQQRELSSLRKVIYAGEAFPVKHLQTLANLIPTTSLYNLYGPTETNVITYYHLHPQDLETMDEIPIGFSCPYANIKVVNENNAEVGVGKTGELIVQTDSLMTEYLKKPNQTSAVIRNVSFEGENETSYYFTGDVVERLDKDLYRIIGRKDSMVKYKGFRIELGGIEAAILKHQEVNACVTKVLDRENDQKVLKAYVASDSTLTQKELIPFLKEKLPHYMIPEEFEFKQTLAVNSRGKLERMSLN